MSETEKRILVVVYSVQIQSEKRTDQKTQNDGWEDTSKLKLKIKCSWGSLTQENFLLVLLVSMFLILILQHILFIITIHIFFVFGNPTRQLEFEDLWLYVIEPLLLQ